MRFPLLGERVRVRAGQYPVRFSGSSPIRRRVIIGCSEARHADRKALTDPRVNRLIQERGIILTTRKERRTEAAAMR